MCSVFPTVCLMAFILFPQGSNSLPWAMPGNFLQRFQMSDVVVAGTVEASSPRGVERVDGTELNANTAKLLVDRIFQGKTRDTLQFVWFTIPMDGTRGFVYSGPPLANMRPYRRYLLFRLVSKICGLISVPEAARGCDIGLFPWHRRYEIRRIVWSPLEFYC